MTLDSHDAVPTRASDTHDGAEPSVPAQETSRRAFLAFLGSAAAAGSLAASDGAADASIDLETLRAAERLAGLELTADERSLMLEGLANLRDQYASLRQVDLANSVSPALVFDPLAGGRFPPAEEPRATGETNRRAAVDPPAGDDLPFADVVQLGALLRSGDRTSTELTELYLERLERLGPTLECVVHSTRERALEEAGRADRELAAGRDRGPLHGIPWGAKDLLAARGYPTTWGAAPYQNQVIDEDATVVQRLTEAGAVLTAKLTLGALAWGDVWFGGRTRNPWNLEQGSSGSSAGSASATAAGLAGFTLGSETWGSIVSPCTRCGVTGLRPTFGHVSRHGAMALSWSMDKLGPIARSVDDCALVLEAIHGADDLDPAVHPRPFRWRRDLDPSSLRVGVVRSAFEEERPDEAWRTHDLEVLETLERLGLNLVDVELPTQGDDALPVEALGFVLSVEAAAAFDELTRSGKDDQLVRQIQQAWPNVFRQARMIPAVEYVQANRVRTLAMERTARLMERIDVFVCPSYGANNLLLTNLTGHPAIVVPNGFREDGTPTSITFTGGLFGENALIAVAGAYQRATDHHLRRPDLAAVADR